MNYWIVVSTQDKTDPNVSGLDKWQKRKDDCFWGVPESNRVDTSIVTGDKAFFYVGSPEMLLVGPVHVLSGIHQLSEAEKTKLWSESVAFTATQGFFFKMDEEACGVCNVRSLVKNNDLKFVKDKDNWQFSFHHSLICIEQLDYETILRAMEAEPVHAPHLFQESSLSR
jgi:hypothetical protein